MAEGQPVHVEAIEYPDLEEYREASFQHAESHSQAGTDFEGCDADDCPHWPSWWQEKAVEAMDDA